MKNYRLYWQNPSMTSELSKEEKQKVMDKFLEVLAKSKEKNAEWRREFMRERNKNLPRACRRGS